LDAKVWILIQNALEIVVQLPKRNGDFLIWKSGADISQFFCLAFAKRGTDFYVIKKALMKSTFIGRRSQKSITTEAKSCM
jgi:hypothetical protein